jgi:hypothetical protein
MMKKLPHKIFNRCKRIPFNTTIYTTREKGDYKFCGMRDRRITNESVLYSVPNNKNPHYPNIKGFQREEMDNLWDFLLTNNSISIQDMESKYPALIKEGKCCFAAFYGLINFLFPNQFTKSKSKIKLNPFK